MKQFNFKKVSFLLLLMNVFFLGSNTALAQSMGIYESYALININGAGNTFYDLTAATTNPDFSGANLGTFTSSQTLVIAGAQNKTFKCSGGNVTGGNTYYRVYLTSGSAPAYTTLSPVMSFVSNDSGGCGGNQTWQTNTGTVNILQGLSAGSYSLQMYTDATGSPSTSTTAAFTANFTISSSPFVFYDNFNRATLSPGGAPLMTYTTTSTSSPVGTATTNSTELVLQTDGTTAAAGRTYTTGPLSTFASPYNSTLNSNTGLVTWSFNMKTNRSTAISTTPFDGSSYTTAVVLCADNTDFLNNSAKGYVVYISRGGTSSTNCIRLGSFTAGLSLTSNVTSILGPSADFAGNTNWVSVKVTYLPSTNTWTLFYRDDASTSTPADPTAGSFTTVGSTSNTTNTTVAMTRFGYFWNHSNGAASSNTGRVDNFSVQVAPSTIPTLSTPTATVTSATIATLGATVTNNGGSTLTARGTAYKTTAGVAASDNPLSEGGTTVAAYTHSRTGLSPQTQYFYVGYATNTVPNTGISAEGSFRTFSSPPTAQPSTFTTTAGSSQLIANWGAATFPGSGATQAGYALVYSTGTPTLTSANGVAPAAGVGTLVNITPTVLPAVPATTTTITGLTNGTLYNLLIVPYTWDGTNASTYNYLTSSARTTTGTPAAISYSWSGGTSGAWNNSGSWTPAGIPATGDAVTFNTGGNVSVTGVPTVSLSNIILSTTGTNVTLAPAASTSATITLNNASTALSIASGTTLNLIGNTTGSATLTLAYSGSGNTATIAGTLNLQNSGSGAGNYNATSSTSTVNGIMTVNNTTSIVTSTTSNLIFASNSEFTHANNGGAIPTATWNPSSTLRVTGITNATAFSANSVSQTFGNIIWDCSSQSSDFVFVAVTTAPSLAAAAGSFTVNRTNTGSLQLPGADKATFTIGGSFTQTGGTVYVNNGGTGNRTLSITGGFTINQNTTTSVFNISNTNSNTTTNTLNLAGDFNMSAGTISRVAQTANVNFNGSSAQTISKTGGTISGIVNFIVPSPSIVYFPSTSLLDGTSATFNLNSGATLQTANTGGISTSGSTGSIQVGSTRTFSPTANYVYNGSVAQVTGAGLPSSITNFTVANTGPAAVQLSQDLTVTGTLSLTGGSLDLNAKTLTLNSAAAAQSVVGSGSNSFIISSSVAGGIVSTTGSGSHTITLSGFGTTSGGGLIIGSNATLRLDSNAILNCGGNGSSTSMLTINNRLLMNGITASNIAATTAPFYGSSSTLEYAVTYGPFQEWLAGTAITTPGVPQNVTINGTGITVTMPSTDRNVKGNLTITSGNLTLNATSGDIYVAGNFTNNATFTHNTRAVFLNGTTQTLNGSNINGSGTTNCFPYLLLQNGTNVTLGASAAITNTLTLTSGKLTLSTFDLNMGSASIAGATSSNYIVTNSTGQLKRTVGSSVLFPVGNSTYNPITISNSATSDTYGIIAIDGAVPNASVPAQAVNKRWAITEGTSGGGNLSVTPQYNSGETGASFSTSSQVYVGLYNSSAWTTNTTTVVGTNPFTAPASSFTNSLPASGTASYFAIGNNGLNLVAPTVGSTVTATSITDITASSGGASITGSSLSAKGIVYSTSNAIPTLSDTVVVNGDTTAADFTSNLTSLSPQTRYYVRAYATNASGTGYASAINFRTLSAEPTAAAGSFSSSVISSSQINLSWTTATFPGAGASNTGYIILTRLDGTNPTTTNVVDGTAPTSLSLPAGTNLVSTINSGSTILLNNTGLIAGQTYNYIIIPFTWDGTNSATYNYYLTSAPTTNALTPAGLPTITTTVAATSITSSSVVTGGQTIADGGNTLTSTGVVYDTTAGPTTSSPKTDNGISTSNFITSIPYNSSPALSPQTLYYARAYATNSGGTAYANEIQFRTLSANVASQSASVSATVNGSGSIGLSWSAATFPSSGATQGGYVVIYSTGTPSLTSANGTAPAGSNFIVITPTNLSSTQPATTTTITGLTGGTSYTFSVIPFTWDGTNATTYNYLTSGAPTVSRTAVTLASIATTGVTNISNSIASTGGNTITIGGGSVIAKGLVYSTAATSTNPTLSINTGVLTDGTITTADFTSNLTGLTSQTQYYVRAYVTNEAGTSYGTSIPFYTYATLPTVQATAMSASATSSSNINLSWSGATFPSGTTTGYFLIRASGSNTPSLSNGNGAAPVAGANTTIVSTLAGSATSTTNSSLTASTTYNYRLVPFTWDGTNAATYNYLTSGTIANASATTLTAAPTAQPTSISFSAVSSSAITTSWTAASGSPAGYIVIRGTGVIPNTDPVSGISYSAGTTLGNATVVYVGSASTTGAQSGLIDGTTYNYKIYSYNGSGSGTNYLITSPLSGSQATSAITAPIATSATNVTATGFTANWGAVSGAASYQLDVSTNSCFSTFGSASTATEGFASGTTAPTGWIITAGSTYTSVGNYGVASPALSLNGSGQIITTNQLSGSVATQLSFWIKGQSTDAGSALLVEGTTDGTNWTTIENITNSLPTSGTTKIYNSTSTPALPCGMIRFRFTYTKSNGNLGFDDVAITSATATNSFVSGYNNLSVSGTSQVVSGLTGNTTYYYRVRTVGTNSTSSNSNTVTTTTLNDIGTADFRYKASTTGNWSNTANWEYNISGTTWVDAGQLPTSNNNINIQSTSVVTLDQNFTIGISKTVTVNGTLNTGTNIISGTGGFTLASGATLGIGSTTGITGNIALSGTTSYSSAANYIFNGGANQNTGAWATTPTANTVNSITINNSGNTVTNTFGASLTATSLTLTAGNFAVGSANTISIAASGTVSSSGGAIASGTAGGTVNFVGAGTISGATAITFNNVTINTGALTLSTVPTFAGTFQINGGNVTAAPIYGASSTLYYNGNYGRYLEWTAIGNGTIGTTAGYPNNVTVNTGTFNVYNSASGAARAMAGNLTVNNGGSFDCNVMNATLTIGGNVTINTGGTMNFNNNTTPVIVTGNISNAGTLSLSTTTGGDIKVGGNWTKMGTFTPNGRAVYFTGSGTNTITASSGETFAYLVSEKTGGAIKLANNLTVTAPSTGNALSLKSAASFDLNGNTLSLTNTTISNIQADGGVVNFSNTSATRAIINFTSANKTMTAINSGTFVFASNIDLTTSTGVDFGTISTVNGTFQINSGGFVQTNAPTYGSTSTLIYNAGSTYTAASEWTSNASTGQGVPSNVTIGNGTPTTLSFGTSTQFRQANGNVTIAASSGLTLSSIVGGDLRIGGNFANSGTFTHNTRGIAFNGSGAQSISGTLNNGTAATNILTFVSITNTTGTVSLGSNVNFGGTSATIAANARLDVGSNTLTINSGNTLTVNGFLRNAGTITNTGTITFSSSGTYEHNFTTTPGTIPIATWSTGSTCSIIGYTTGGGNGFKPLGLNQTFSNFTWNCPSQTTRGTLDCNANTSFSVGGTFTVAATNTGALSFAEFSSVGGSLGSTINVANINITGGTFYFIYAFSNNGNFRGTFASTGNYTQNGGNVYLGYGNNTGRLVTTQFNLTGASSSFTQSGGIFTMTNVPPTSTAPTNVAMTLSGASASMAIQPGATFNFSGDNTAINFATGSAPIVTLSGASSSFSQTGGTIDFNSYTTTGSGVLNVAGSFTRTGTGIMTTSSSSAPNGIVNFNGGSGQTLNDSSTGTLSRVDFNVLTGSTVALQNNFALATCSSCALPSFFTVNSGGTLNCGTFNINNNLTGNGGNFTNNGTLGIGSSSGITSGTTTSGNIQVTGTALTGAVGRIYNATASYIYNGTTSGVTGNGLPASITGNVTINNANGVTLSQNTAFTGVGALTLTNGILSTNGNTLSLANSTTGSDSSFVKTDATGTLTMTGVTTAKTLPFGTTVSATNYYTPLTLAVGTSTSYTGYTTETLPCVFSDPTKAIKVAWYLNTPTVPTSAIFQWNTANNVQPSGFNSSGTSSIGRYSGTCSLTSYLVTSAGSASGTSPNTVTATSGFSNSGMNAYVIGNTDALILLPKANPATSVAGTSFQANWDAFSGAVSYELDVNKISNSVIVSQDFESVTAPALPSEWQNTTRWMTSNTNTANGVNCLRSNAIAAGTEYIYMQPATYDVTSGTYIWRFNIRTGYVPTTNNNARYYLMADGTNLTAANGYSVGFNASGAGTADDILKLYKNAGSSASVLITSAQTVASGTYYGVEVTRTSSGVWTLKTQSGGGFSAMTTASTTPTDTTYTNSTYTGLVASATLTNITNLRLDDLSISQQVITPVSGYTNLSVSGTSQVVTGLDPSTDYSYLVRAVGSTSTSFNSNTINVTTSNDISNADFRYVASTTGNWSTVANWEYNSTGATWVSAGQLPGATNNVNIPSTSNVTLDQGFTINSGKTLTVRGTLDATTNIIQGTGNFLLGTGSTFKIGSADGISTSGATGNVQTSTRVFVATANYQYNGAGDQITGTGLPTTITTGSLAVNSGSNTVTLTNTGTTVSTLLSLVSGTFAIGSGNTINVSAAGTVSSTGGTIASGVSGGTVAFAGAGTITGTVSFNNLTLNGITTLPSTVTVNGNLTFNATTASVTNAPSYGSSSNLIYAASVSRGGEWSTSSSGAGYPVNVIVQNGATLTANQSFDVGCSGNLQLGSTGSTGSLTMVGAGKIIVTGNVTIGSDTGTSNLVLSSTTGGDIKLGGNWTRTSNGTFTPNVRAVFFTGSATNVINSNGGATFDYFVSEKTGGSIQLGSNLTVNAPSGGNAMSLKSAASFDLNGNTLNLTNSVSSNVQADGGIVNFTGTGTINVTSSTKTYTQINSGSFSFDNNVILTTSTGVNFGSGLSTINGTFQINGGGFVQTNAPIYGSSSTLVYNSNYGRNLEWSATSGAGYPNNVKVIGGSTLDLSANGYADRSIAGNLSLGEVGGTSGSLSMGASNKKLTVGGNIIIGGNTSGTSTISLSSAIGGDIYINGDWTRNTGGSFVTNSRAVFFQGTGTSTINTITTASFDYLFINKTGAGKVVLSNDMTVNNNLSFSSGNTGVIQTDNNKVIIPATSGITRTGSGHINGNLRRFVPTGTVTGFSLPIGDASNYSPAAINFTGTVSGTGYLDAAVTIPGAAPSVDSGLSQTKYVDRKWTITNSGVTGFTSFAPTFTFVSGDVQGSATSSLFKIRNFNGSAWSSTTLGAALATSTSASGVTLFGDFVIGENGGISVSTQPIDSTVCNGSDASFVAASISIPTPTVKWQRSADGGTSWFDITSNLDAGTTYSNFTTNTLNLTSSTTALNAYKYRVIYTNMNGSSTNSSEVTLTVNSTTVGGSVTGGTASCAGAASPSMSLSGNTGAVVRWESSVSPFTTWSTIANTLSTYTASSVSETTRFRAVVQSGACNEAAALYTTVTVSSTIWDGSTWSNGAPTSGVSATITGALNVTSSIVACNLVVASTGSVTVATGQNITLDGTLSVATGGSFTLANNANLYQNTTSANTGNISVTRNSAPLIRQDYTLWSSPVSGQQLFSFSPLTISNRFYTYNSDTNLYNSVSSPSTTNFEDAKGYLIRVPNNFSATTPTAYTGIFTGVPHNGDYNFSMFDGGSSKRFNLVGNPYPSPISAMSFVTANSNNITGVLYFWRKTNNPANPTYCTWSAAGGGNGTFVSNGQAQVVNPNGIIQTGQGFFVEGSGSGTDLIFNNSMRAVNNTGQFFRNTTIQSHRVWLNATNNQNIISQTVVGYFSNATQAVDSGIDGKFMNDGAIEFASIIDSNPYAIQGRALPFQTNDVVQMHFKASTAGTFTISIDHADGLFDNSNQSVFIKDNVLNVTHDLKQSAYTFAADAGTTDTRFELVYENTLATSTPQFTANSVVVYKNNKQIQVNAGTTSLDSIKVFDISGRLLKTLNKINATQATIDATAFANQVLMLQITSTDQTTVTKKVIN